MKIIVDTNIFLAVALDEPEKEEIIQKTGSASILSPDILPYEIGNALSAMLKRQQITEDEVLPVLESTRNIPVRLLTVDIKQALKIAMEFNIYAYDAYFLQCAKSTSNPLYTMDKRMKMVARKLRIPLIGESL